MTPADTRRMVSIVRAIRAGKWTNELPDWAPNTLTSISVFSEDDGANELRAIQTAEAFIILGVATSATFNVAQFLHDCGFRR